MSRAAPLLAALAALSLAPGCVTALVLGIPSAGPPIEVDALEAARVGSDLFILRVLDRDGEARVLRWRPDRDRQTIAGPGEVTLVDGPDPDAGIAVVTSRGDGPLPAGVTWDRLRGRLWEDGRCTDDVWLARDGEVGAGRVVVTVLLVPLSVIVDAATWPFQLIGLLFIL